MAMIVVALMNAYRSPRPTVFGVILPLPDVFWIGLAVTIVGELTVGAVRRIEVDFSLPADSGHWQSQTALAAFMGSAAAS